MSNPSSNNLSFRSFEITKVLFTKAPLLAKSSVSVLISHRIEKDVSSSEANQELFRFIFLVKVTSNEEDKELEILVEGFGLFEIKNDPPAEEVENLKYLSAPIITYPYIRSFISTLTVNSGIDGGIIIPPINFHKENMRPRS